MYVQLYQQVKQRIRNLKFSNKRASAFDYAELCESANKVAMHSLKQSDINTTKEYLKKAERYCIYSEYLMMVTYNNWSCYYKKIQQYSLALLNINKALKIAHGIKEELLNQDYHKAIELAHCYLNLCTILSEMGQHRLAYDNALLAIQYLKFQMSDKYSHKEVAMKDIQSVLTIAKFNQAVQLEFLKKNNEAISLYRQLKVSNCVINNAVQRALASLQSKIVPKRKKSSLPSIKSTTLQKQNQPNTGLKIMKKRKYICITDCCQ